MSVEIVAFAESLATALQEELDDRENKAKATANIRQAGPPSIMVTPIPRREYDDLANGYEATWSIYCVAQGPGDLTDARVLDELVDVVTTVVPTVSLVEPVQIQLPGVAEPKPAMRCEFSNHVTPSEEE